MGFVIFLLACILGLLVGGMAGLAICGFIGAVVGLIYGFVTSGGPTSEVGDIPASPVERSCPCCAELVKIEAKLCKHCKSELPKTEPPKKHAPRKDGKAADGIDWG